MSSWFDLGGLHLVYRIILIESDDVSNRLIGTTSLDRLIIYVYEQCDTMESDHLMSSD